MYKWHELCISLNVIKFKIKSHVVLKKHWTSRQSQFSHAIRLPNLSNYRVNRTALPMWSWCSHFPFDTVLFSKKCHFITRQNQNGAASDHTITTKELKSMLKVQKLRDQLGTRITITWSGRNTHRVRTWGGKKNQSFFLKGNELKIILKCILGGVGGPKKNTPSCSIPTPYQLRTSSVPVTPYTLCTKCIPSAYNPRRKTLLDSDWSRSFWTLSLL